MHISSLPDQSGVGSLGAEARKFVDFLEETNQKLWQILPLGPIGYGNSPYQCFSAFAGCSLFIDLPTLVEDGLLSEDDLADPPKSPKDRVNYDLAWEYQTKILKKAFVNFQEEKEKFHTEYLNFLSEHSWWLDDYAMFRAIKGLDEQKIWNTWDKKLRLRDEHQLDVKRHKLATDIDFHRFLQFLFFRQWHELKKYANEKGIKIIGDIPLYVSLDSSDVWANQDIFMLDDRAKPTLVGGVPPDYFSETGQLWGNPVFNWNRLRERNYDWWIARIHFNLRMFDLVRIDHFRGFESFWAIPAKAKTAEKGEWLPAYGYDLLKLLKKQIGKLPVIAEDLGVITPEVEKLRDDFKLPGMKILQFAFTSDEKNKDLPHNMRYNFIAYTGTHDNNTSVGWLKNAENAELALLRKYLRFNRYNFSKHFIEMAWGSVAKMAIIPIQDLIGLDKKGRMNIPGTPSDNWEWRFDWKMLKKKHRRFLKEITLRYNR